MPRRIRKPRRIRVGIQILLQAIRLRDVPRPRVLCQESTDRWVVETSSVVVEPRVLVALLTGEHRAAGCRGRRAGAAEWVVFRVAARRRARVALVEGRSEVVLVEVGVLAAARGSKDASSVIMVVRDAGRAGEGLFEHSDAVVRAGDTAAISIGLAHAAAGGWVAPTRRSSALTLRFCRFPEENQTWLWCHILTEGRLYEVLAEREVLVEGLTVLLGHELQPDSPSLPAQTSRAIGLPAEEPSEHS